MYVRYKYSTRYMQTCKLIAYGYLITRPKEQIDQNLQAAPEIIIRELT